MNEQREALAEALFDVAFPGEREKDPYWYQAYEHDWYAQADRLLASPALARLFADAEQRGAARVTAADMDPWGPFEMGGFDTQPTCRICDRDVEQGEQAWARQWPRYDTLPLDHKDQDWDVISWHDECPPAAAQDPA